MRTSWWSTWPADAQREVDLLGLQPGDLAAEQVDRRWIVVARRAEQLGVALVAAEDRVGQVEEDQRGLGEVGVALVLEAPGGHRVGGGLGLGQLDRQDRALGGQLVDDRLAGQRLVVDRRPAVPRRALPEALGRGIRVGLGRVEPVGGGRPRRQGLVTEADIVRDVRPVECLGDRPERLGPEAERLALVGGQVISRAVAREDGQDRHVLAQLAQ